jgi:hypothetical protein
MKKKEEPGVGGVDPRELELLLLERTSLRALRLDEEEALPAYNREFLTCCCCPCCCTRNASNLTGLGMKPTSEFSLTRLPIHQSLSYFSCYERIKEPRAMNNPNGIRSVKIHTDTHRPKRIKGESFIYLKRK